MTQWSPNRLSPKLRQLEGSSTVQSAGLKALWLSRKSGLKVCLTLNGDRAPEYSKSFCLVDYYGMLGFYFWTKADYVNR